MEGNSDRILLHNDETDLSDSMDDLADLLENIGANYDRKITIIQPRSQETSIKNGYENIKQGICDSETNRLRQLNTLLLSAQAACRSFGAELSVITEKNSTE